MSTSPSSNQPPSATLRERADIVITLFKTTMVAYIPPLSEAALHHLIVEAIAAATDEQAALASRQY